MAIRKQMGIEEIGDAQAYKSKESKSFGYANNIIIIIKVKINKFNFKLKMNIKKIISFVKTKIIQIIHII